MNSPHEKFAAIYNDVDRYPSLRHVADALGLTIKTVRNKAGILRSARQEDQNIPQLVSRVGTGRREDKPNDPSHPVFYSREPVRAKKREKSTATKRYIITSSQDQSLPHIGFLDNLEAYARWLGECEIISGAFTVNKSIYDDRDPRPQSKKTNPVHFHERFKPYLTHDQIELCEGLVFCGEMNTLPTAVLPLSGFETYTGNKWGIFPHAKVQLQAIPTMKHERPKHLMTTGCATLPNYIQKKAGIKAAFHHIIGAVIVEVEPDGAFFCRHIQADGLKEDQGGFYDLDRRIENGTITVQHRVEALNYGDIHHEKLDPVVAQSTWGYDVNSRSKSARVSSPTDTITGQPLLDYLRPHHQFFHDLSDFTPRNHHNIKDPHFRFVTHAHDAANVEYELDGCAAFLHASQRPWCKSVVVQSNHDNALVTWLKNSDYRDDPENAIFFLKTQLSYFSQLQAGVSEPPIFEQCLREMHCGDDIIFVAEDDSYVIGPGSGIECAMHGHLGANGSRGNPRQFTRFGKRSNTGHTHTAQITDGAYVAGVSGKLDMGYNRGASSWSHSHIVTYLNGKRAILTMMNGRWYGGACQNKSSVKTRKSLETQL